MKVFAQSVTAWEEECWVSGLQEVMKEMLMWEVLQVQNTLEH